MFCPECKAEYRAGFTTCSDCSVDLIDSLPAPAPPGDGSGDSLDANQPGEIARFVDIRQAEFALSVLEGNGIAAYIDQSFTGSIAPHFMLGSGGVCLRVGAEDRQRAIEVLQSAEELTPDQLAGGPEG
jgi:hypothetical protein